MSCAAPIGLEALAGYWLAELPPAEAEKLEEHFFGCAHCALRLEELAALGTGVRAAVRAGKVGLAVSQPFVEAMKRAGMRLREYRAEPGGRVDCTLRADEDAVVSRIRAPLAGVARVDLLERIEADGSPARSSRLEDVPFDPAAGEVVILPLPRALKAMPAHKVTMRLVAVDASGERPLGEYAFVHTPG